MSFHLFGDKRINLSPKHQSKSERRVLLKEKTVSTKVVKDILQINDELEYLYILEITDDDTRSWFDNKNYGELEGEEGRTIIRDALKSGFEIGVTYKGTIHSCDKHGKFKVIEDVHCGKFEIVEAKYTIEEEEFLDQDRIPDSVLNNQHPWYAVARFYGADGPAIEHYVGIKEWYIGGAYHRSNLELLKKEKKKELHKIYLHELAKEIW